MRSAIRDFKGECGQASIEFLGALPLILALAAVLLQGLVAGHAWLELNQAAGVAARSFATAKARGEAAEAAANRSARGSLSSGIRKGVLVSFRRDQVRLSRRLPVIPPFAFLGRRIPTLRTSAVFAQ